MNPKNFGKNLREIMQFLNLNQSQLAEKTGLTQAAISQILNSERTPSIESIVKILAVVPTTFERLMK